MSDNAHVYAVILAGGGGTRLWPKSRNKTPKQFLKLTSKETMMQLAANRISKIVPWEKMIVVTNQKYEDEVKLQLPQVPTANIICEPKKRDTALAMLAGALYTKSLDPQAVVINSASDHIVVDETEYIRVMKAAVAVAAKGQYLVTVGITPAYATSAFGYIKIGDELGKLDRGLSLFKVNSFTEKPNEATARAYISTGRYFWNANMYVWSAQALDEAFAQHMPNLYQLTRPLAEKKDRDFKQELEKVYNEAEAISIDYAISEKADNLVLIPGDFGWDDVGDWKVVFNLGVKDLAGNVIIGDGNSDKIHTLTIESQNNLIHVGDRLVALVGVSDMVIVDTPEIVMIAPKSKSQEVKKLVERLKEEGKEEYL